MQPIKRRVGGGCLVEDEGKTLSACVLHIVCEKGCVCLCVCVCVCGPCLTVCISECVSVDFCPHITCGNELPYPFAGELPPATDEPRQQ